MRHRLWTSPQTTLVLTGVSDHCSMGQTVALLQAEIWPHNLLAHTSPASACKTPSICTHTFLVTQSDAVQTRHTHAYQTHRQASQSSASWLLLRILWPECTYSTNNSDSSHSFLCSFPFSALSFNPVSISRALLYHSRYRRSVNAKCLK